MDVKLSASRTAKIHISDLDNPLNLAKQFGKVYSLDHGAVEVLAKVIQQSMEQNSIPIETGFNQSGSPSIELLPPPPPPPHTGERLSTSSNSTLVSNEQTAVSDAGEGELRTLDLENSENPGSS